MSDIEFTPTPEGKQWLDSLGPQIVNLALANEAERLPQSDVEFVNWQITEIVRKWAASRPHQIMEVKP